MVRYYFLALVIMAFQGIFYLDFRWCIPDYLRRRHRIGKHRLRKMRGSFPDRLWFTPQHRTFGLGWIYHLNRCYTVLAAAAIALHLLLGWHPYAAAGYTVLFCLCTLLLIPLSALSYAEHLRGQFGRVFVLFGFNRRKGIDSVLFLFGNVLLILMSAVGQVSLWQDFCK